MKSVEKGFALVATILATSSFTSANGNNGIKGRHQLRRKRGANGAKIEQFGKSWHNDDQLNSYASSRKALARHLLISEGEKSKFGAFGVRGNDTPTEYVISGEDFRTPSVAPGETTMPVILTLSDLYLANEPSATSNQGTSSITSPIQMPITVAPTNHPSQLPFTAAPTNHPSQMPITAAPTNHPSQMPITADPTSQPSKMPITPEPTSHPSQTPTMIPTKAPIMSAADRAYMTANNVVSGVNANLEQGVRGPSKSTSKSKIGAYSASASGKVKGKSYMISSAEETALTKKQKSNGSKSAFKLGKKSTGKSGGGFAVEGASGKSKGKKGTWKSGGGFAVEGASSKSKGKKGAGKGWGGFGVEGASGKKGTGKSGGGTGVEGDYVISSGYEDASTSPVSNAIGAPSPLTSPSGVPGAPSPYAPPSGVIPSAQDGGSPQRVVDSVVDCEAISQGTAPTDAPNQKTFRVDADWTIVEDINFDELANGVQEYLQLYVAPVIAGCDMNSRRRLQFMSAQTLVSHVQFSTPTQDSTDSCSTDKVSAVCVPTDTDVDVNFYGVDNGVGGRLLRFLQAAGTYPVNGLLGVANLSVSDSDGNRISTDGTTDGGSSTGGGSISDGGDNNGGNAGSGSNNGNGGDESTENDGSGSNNGNGGDGSTENGLDPVTGIDDGASNGDEQAISPGNSVAGAQGQETEGQIDEDSSGLSKWSKTLIGVSAATAMLGVIVCFLLFRFCCGRNEPDRDEKDDLESLPPEQPIPRTVRTPLFFDDDKSAFSNEWRGSRSHDPRSFNTTEPGSPDSQGGGTEVAMSRAGDTHVCKSATCEVCARNNQVHFLPIEAESFDEAEQLPTDATRNYYVSDTVDL